MILKVGYQGIPGAYSHEMCELWLPAYEAVGFESFHAVLDAFKAGEVNKAILPIRNSSVGAVEGVQELLEEYKITPAEERALAIDHKLMAPQNSSLAMVTEVWSHRQALKQCRDNLKRHGFLIKDVGDTAGGAQKVANENDPTIAAIASAKAAELYGLTILDANIRDQGDNETTFVLCKKES